MTIYQTLLARGFFPKELPPAFFTEQFARYATTKSGRLTISKYKPVDNFTECVKYLLALPGSDRRELRIPHPAAFATLAGLTAKNFKRLLTKTSSSPFSKSRPVYATGRHRALRTVVSPSNLARERAAFRAGAAVLLRTDVSQFYPSLYTHAVGWAIDPILRDKANWKNNNLLGKKLDQCLMDMDGKVSQGIPIGNDISFLLAESVLAQVDKALGLISSRSYRWFDDYEIAFNTRNEAEVCLKQLSRELGKFRLRLNAKKTRIIQLPQPAQDEWQAILSQTGTSRFTSTRDMVKHFDSAFRLREQFPDSSVLLYALAVLFGLRCPTPDVGRIAQSCITQALLCEPGAAQKAFALLSYWRLNGFSLDSGLIANTVNQLIFRHEATGLSSDVAWALAFSLEQKIALDIKASKVLSIFDDGCVALQALHMHSVGLLPKGFSTTAISKVLKNAHLDREHWLIAYEAVRHGFLTDSESAVKGNPLFSELLARKISFYRTELPVYAHVIHPGGAPEWVVRAWMKLLREPEVPIAGGERLKGDAMLEILSKGIDRIKATASSPDEAVVQLMEVSDNADSEPNFAVEMYGM